MKNEHGASTEMPSKKNSGWVACFCFILREKKSFWAQLWAGGSLGEVERRAFSRFVEKEEPPKPPVLGKYSRAWCAELSQWGPRGRSPDFLAPLMAIAASFFGMMDP